MEIKVGSVWKWCDSCSPKDNWTIDEIIFIDNEHITTKVLDSSDTRSWQIDEVDKLPKSNLKDSEEWTQLKYYNTPLWKVMNS